MPLDLPHVKREFKKVLDSGFRIPDTEFLSLSVELGFRDLIVRGIPDPISCIPDYGAEDCGFHKQNFPDSGILISLHGNN